MKATVFRRLASFGRSLQQRHERYLEEKKRRLKKGDVSLAQSWEDVEKAFNSILDGYAKGRISLEGAEEKIDRIANYITRYSMMFTMRGFGYHPEMKAWQMAKQYKVMLHQITPVKPKKVSRPKKKGKKKKKGGKKK